MSNFNFVSLVPPEIWVDIFEKLHKEQYHSTSTTLAGNDLLNCCRTCLSFQTILNGTKHLWLFQEVLPLLIPYIHGSLLPLRATCIAWKRAVDHVLENYQHYHSLTREMGRCFTRKPLSPTFIENNSLNIEPTDLPICVFRSNKKIVTFLESMKNHSGSGTLFPGGTVYLEMAMTTQMEQQLWEENVINLLCHYGKFVRVFHIKLELNPGIQYTCEGLSQIANVILLFVPNIKRISLHVDGHLDRPRGITSRNPCFSQCLPNFPSHLESIEFEDNDMRDFAIPVSFQLKLSTPYFSMLKRYQLSLIDDDLEDIEFPTGCLSQLEELVLKLRSTSQIPDLGNMTGDTLKLQRICIKVVNFQEQRLNQDISYQTVKPDITLGNILKPIQLAFGRCLRTLIIVTVSPNSPMMQTCASHADIQSLSGFSCLKYLHMEGYSFLKIRLLEHLPQSLEYLLLDGERRWSWSSMSLTYRTIPYISIDLPDEQGESRLWKLLPRLKWLSVLDRELEKRVLYRREDLEWLVKTREEDEDETTTCCYRCCFYFNCCCCCINLKCC